jgi:hypothetical protein
MAQRRMISRNLGSSRKFHAVNARCGKLGDFAQAVFPLLVVNADDFGRLEGDAFTVKHKVFPVSPRSEDDFETVLQAMNDVGLIRFYQVGPDRYLEIANFDREQPGLHKRTKSDYPDPPPQQESFGKFPEVPGSSGESREIPGDSGNPGKFPDEPNLTEPNRTEQTPNRTAADAAVPASPEALLEIYKANNKTLPQVLEFGPERRDKCRRRLARDPQKFIDQFTRAVIKAQEVPFLRGEGDRGWKADFDWLIANDRNVLRILEGRYDSGARASPASGGESVFEKIRRERQEGKHGSDRVA